MEFVDTLNLGSDFSKRMEWCCPDDIRSTKKNVWGNRDSKLQAFQVDNSIQSSSEAEAASEFLS